jgi:hypothetical protein
MKITFKAEIKSFELQERDRVLVSFRLTDSWLQQPELKAFDNDVRDVAPLTMTVHRKVVVDLKLGQKFKIELETDSR